MANDNRRRPPHGHDPEQARREAAKAREARRKHSGSASRNSRSHSTGTRRNDISKKSRYYQVRRQKMFLAAGGILIILILVIIFSARACISSRKAAEAAALQKAQEEEAAKKAKEEAAAVKDPVSLTLSVVGDCTLGTDETFDYDTSLNAYYDSNGKDYFFQNVLLNRTRTVNISRRPTIIRMDKNILAKSCRFAKLSIGPISPNPGPTLLILEITALQAVAIS
mgnify:CR=1 FL=1